MSVKQNEKAARLRALHDGPGAFVIPNPWDVGSARILVSHNQQSNQALHIWGVADQPTFKVRMVKKGCARFYLPRGCPVSPANSIAFLLGAIVFADCLSAPCAARTFARVL